MNLGENIGRVVSTCFRNLSDTLSIECTLCVDIDYMRVQSALFLWPCSHDRRSEGTLGLTESVLRVELSYELKRVSSAKEFIELLRTSREVSLDLLILKNLCGQFNLSEVAEGLGIVDELLRSTLAETSLIH